MKPVHILAVEDESDFEFLLNQKFKERLESGELRFSFARDGLEALEHVRQHPDIAVAFIDIKMPRMDGFTLLSHLKEDYPLVCPVIISAYHDMPNIRTAMNCGAYDFLTKPVNFSDLEIILQKAIQQHCIWVQNQQMHETLHASQEQYREMIEQISDGVAVVQEDRIVFANDALCAILAESPECIRQMSPDILVQDTPTSVGKPASKVDSPESWHVRHTTGEGRDLWLETCARQIQWYDTSALLVTVRDISEQKRRELAIEAEKTQLENENLALKGVIRTLDRFGPLIGRSQAMQKVYEQVLYASEHDIAVLITGESGTGKELVARTIHQLSARAEQSFVPVNCGSLRGDLVESELFGHRKGAFTGASATHTGLFEAAHQGTLFLDEVAELPPETQVRLLRALDSGEIRPVGSTTPYQVDVRIITATNQDLSALVHKKRFRNDLFQRMGGAQIALPPLRDRREDIPLLCEYFLNHFAQPEAQKDLPRKILDQLCAYHWPGNVRELQNVLSWHVMTGAREFFSQSDKTRGGPGKAGTLKERVEDFEKTVLLQALQHHSGSRAATIEALGIPERTLYRKLKKYGIIP